MKPHPSLAVSLLSALLLLPAAFVCCGGALWAVTHYQPINDFMSSMMSSAWLKPFFSPVVIVGGPLAAGFWNLLRLCAVSGCVESDRCILAVSIYKLFSEAFFLAVSAGLLALLAAYLFVENFKIVPRVLE